MPQSRRIMTKLAIVAYPILDHADREWIESIRTRHDPQALRIDAHFTLVFPTDVPREPLVSHTSAAVSLAGPIPFAVRRATAARDTVGTGAHVFLVPDEGRDELVRLHDRLYQGMLRPHLREDIPFVPHITVAAHADVQWCEGLAQDVNDADRTVRGELRSLELVDVGTARVRSIMTFRLDGLESPHPQ